MPQYTYCVMREKTLAKIGAIIFLIMVLLLVLNMTDDWPNDPQKNERVFIIAVIFFCFNLGVCCYVCNRLRPESDVPIVTGNAYSVNPTGPLLSGDVPPSYDAVSDCRVTVTDPPSYVEASLQSGATAREQDQPKATG